MLGHIFISLIAMLSLIRFLKALIEEEYKKNPDISPDDIHKLRKWLTTQPHLPGDLITDVDLLLTFYCCEKSQELSKQVLDLHFTIKTMFTQFFKDRSLDEKIETCMNTILAVPIPTPSLEGYRVGYLRLLDPDPKNYNVVDSFRTLTMIFDLWQYEEGSFPGFVIIIDMEGATLSHVLKLDLMVLKKAIYFFQECMLMKLKNIHFINAPFFMDRVISIIKPFLKKELMDILEIHQVGSDTIYKLIPKEAFPKEQGGNYKDHITIRDEMLQRLRANHAFFREENKRRVNESLRKGEKPIKVEKEFGLQGSFKKLDID